MSSYQNAYLSTRISLFASRLMGEHRLRDLLALDVQEILKRVNYFTGQSYQLDYKNPRSLENQLTSSALRDFQPIIRSFSGNERQFFYYTIRWFELVNLKVLIRGKFTRTDNTLIQQQLVDLGDFADLPLKELLETEDPYEMLRLLETTAYAGIVRQARNVFEDHDNDLFLLDANIDRIFFINLKQRLLKLDQQDTASINEVMGILLDRFNLLWLLRYRFSYHLSSAKSYYLLTATGKKLHSATLMRLAKLDNLEEVLSTLPESLRLQLSGLQSISEIEAVLEYNMLEIATKTLRKNNLVARCFSYILLREAETRFLQSVIKGKQLEFNDELIRQAVAGKM